MDLQIRGFADVSLWTAKDAQGNNNPPPQFYGHDLVIFSATLAEAQSEFLKQLKYMGIPYIVDIDDGWSLPDTNPAVQEWRRRQLAVKTQEAIFHAAAVTVENERLGAKVNKINRNWHILQNALDFTARQWNLSRDPSPLYRVGFIGSRSHKHDLIMIADVLREFAEQGGVEVNICGYDPKDAEWTAVGNAIAPEGHPDWLKFRPGVHPFDYGGYYAMMDVVIAPLQSNNWNGLKSDIKVKEAGAYSLPLIASNFGPYLEHLSGGVYPCDNLYDWMAWLERGKAGKLDGRPNAAYLRDEGDLQFVNLRRVEIYAETIAKKAAAKN
jgi:glycosyltransferase involved in cell wall biosynthesis